MCEGVPGKGCVPVLISMLLFTDVSSDVAVGTAVTTLTATDLDEGTFGQDGVSLEEGGGER